MVHICAWCERFLGIKEPADSRQVTHGICDPCFQRQMWEDAPTLVVSRERSDLLPVLHQLLRGVPEIKVVVDRRSGDGAVERRTEGPGGEAVIFSERAEGERRQGERRRGGAALFLS